MTRSTGDVNTESLVFNGRNERLIKSLNFETYRLKPERAVVALEGAFGVSADNDGTTLIAATTSAVSSFVGGPVDGVESWVLNDFLFCGGFKRMNGDDH